MTHARQTAALAAPVALISAALAAPALAQPYDISWSTIDGGGAINSSAGSYTLSGTIGQPDAAVSSSGAYTLTGGFWSRTDSAPACRADLTGSADPNDPSYGQPDGVADSDDFFFYLDAFVTQGLSVCDLTGSSDPNDPSFDIPNGVCDG
ncbi:MAG: GC-type dockerin domain-anchored protein, partial [Phycisphaerales bacterium JB037]